MKAAATLAMGFALALASACGSETPPGDPGIGRWVNKKGGFWIHYSGRDLPREENRHTREPHPEITSEGMRVGLTKYEYEGDLVVSVNRNHIEYRGPPPGSLIHGDLVVSGNGNTIESWKMVVVQGRLIVTGNHNTISGKFIDGIEDRGVSNDLTGAVGKRR